MSVIENVTYRKNIMDKENARVRTANVINIAFKFTAMARVLEKASNSSLYRQVMTN
jgi:hypothetical protein